MLRWLASFAIAALFVLDLALPATAPGRRGAEPELRADLEAKGVEIGSPFPGLEDLGLTDLEGRPVDLRDLRGHRVLLTFERSVDW